MSGLWKFVFPVRFVLFSFFHFFEFSNNHLHTKCATVRTCVCWSLSGRDSATTRYLDITYLLGRKFENCREYVQENTSSGKIAVAALVCPRSALSWSAYVRLPLFPVDQSTAMASIRASFHVFMFSCWCVIVVDTIFVFIDKHPYMQQILLPVYRDRLKYWMFSCCWLLTS